MNIKRVLVVMVACLALIWGCAPSEKQGAGHGLSGFYARMHLEGTVSLIDGQEATILVQMPERDTSSLPFVDRVTHQIVNQSYLLEQSATRIGGHPAVIQEIRGNAFIASFESPLTLKIGDPVKIYIPKKILAITDFEVIRGHDKSISEVSMESLTTAIVNTGQFNVVERNKLNAVLKELEIGLTGLTDTDNAKKVGQLLQADVILTGTFADLGGYWNVNMRLINVNNGLVTAAFEEKASFAEIKPEAVRDVDNINESFDGELKAGWVIGQWQRFGAYRRIEIDRETGARESGTSMKMSFRLNRQGSKAPIINKRKRDLSLYSGIEFYARADQPLVAFFLIMDTNPDAKDKHDRWYFLFEVGTDWNRYEIAFEDMSMAHTYAQKFPGGDGILNLHMVESLEIGVSAFQNEIGATGILWIDEVRFY